MKVVLFCGGLGTRLGELTEDVPKPLVKIGYRPILWHLMKYYAHYGHKDFILCLGYKADKIKDYFLNYNEYISNDFTMSEGGRNIELMQSDIADWKITFVDTGLRANIGQRLKAVQKHLAGEEMFLANYADGSGELGLGGVRAQITLLRGSFDKVGVEPQFAQRKEYKSAAETYAAHEISPANHEMVQQIANSLTHWAVDVIAQRRGRTAEQVWQSVDAGILTPQQAVEHGLVDRVGYRDEVYAEARTAWSGESAALRYVHRHARGRPRGTSSRHG